MKKCKCLIKHQVDMDSVPNWIKYLNLLTQSVCDTTANNVKLNFCPWCGGRLFPPPTTPK